MSQNLNDYDFLINNEQIAVHPKCIRHESRLLVVDPIDTKMSDDQFWNIDKYLPPNCLLIFNDSKVIKSRLLANVPGRKRALEIFVLSAIDSSVPSLWQCLVKPGKFVKDRLDVLIGSVSLTLHRQRDDLFTVQFPFQTFSEIFKWLDENGAVPLPPYIKRKTVATDSSDYQTVYANQPGSSASPTAGRHFSIELIEKLRLSKIQLEYLTLHIGLGTFQPVKNENLSLHKMHTEQFNIEPETWLRITDAKKQGRKIIAVGTTALRAVESASQFGLFGKTDIFIKPGYRFEIIDGLITNFHLPKSTLFILVCSILGIERAKNVYQHAIEQGFRFFSYGDAMLILPNTH